MDKETFEKLKKEAIEKVVEKYLKNAEKNDKVALSSLLEEIINNLMKKETFSSQKTMTWLMDSIKENLNLPWEILNFSSQEQEISISDPLSSLKDGKELTKNMKNSFSPSFVMDTQNHNS